MLSQQATDPVQNVCRRNTSSGRNPSIEDIMTTVTVKTPLGTVERDLTADELKEQNLPEGLFSRLQTYGFTGRSSDTSGDVYVPAALVRISLLYIR
jgi:hypothetical protein